MSTSMEILRCVDPVCGLVQHHLYEQVGLKRHPISGQGLIVVRTWPGGVYPAENKDFGYLPMRFELLRG